MLTTVSAHDLYFVLILDNLTEKIDKRPVLGQIAGKIFALGSVSTDFEKLFFLSVAWPTGVQLLVFFGSSLPMMMFGTPGSLGVGRNTFLSSPHLCFIIVFISDLFVSRDDPLMS